MLKFFKNKKTDLNAELAGQTLQNVFDVCEVRPNTIPLSDLQSYSNYRKDRFVIQKIVLIAIIIIFLALPVMFIGPSIDNVKSSDPGTRPSYEVTVNSLLPVVSVHATIDGVDLPLYEKEKNVYSIEPAESGKMTITVKALNGQWTEKVVNVDNVDRSSPVITGTETKDGYVYIYANDSDSGIAWDDIYALTSDSKMLSPDKVNETEGWVRFRNPKKDITVFISDTSGNMIQLTLDLSADSTVKDTGKDKVKDTDTETDTENTETAP